MWKQVPPAMERCVGHKGLLKPLRATAAADDDYAAANIECRDRTLAFNGTAACLSIASLWSRVATGLREYGRHTLMLIFKKAIKAVLACVASSALF